MNLLSDSSHFIGNKSYIFNANSFVFPTVRSIIRDGQYLQFVIASKQFFWNEKFNLWVAIHSVPHFCLIMWKIIVFPTVRSIIRDGQYLQFVIASKQFFWNEKFYLWVAIHSVPQFCLIMWKIIEKLRFYTSWHLWCEYRPKLICVTKAPSHICFNWKMNV